VQITDLHIGPTIRARYVERVVRLANALKPDLFALTLRPGQPRILFRRRAVDRALPLARLTGTWGPPVRFGSQPELTLIRLARAA
jgi:hypothetical protein